MLRFMFEVRAAECTSETNPDFENVWEIYLIKIKE